MSPAALIDLESDLLPYAEAGMPEGAFPLAVERAVEAAALASGLLGTEVVADALSVALVLHLPEVMAASYGSVWWPTPPSPRPAPGGGWFDAELGSPENAESFERLMGSRSGSPDAVSIAAAAQEWRLPVCDYREPAELPPWRDEPAAPAATPLRTKPGAAPSSSAGPDSLEVRSAPPPTLRGLRVLDLTSMWAGPLTTWLLARLGADVVKIEPTVRPDGFRARHGRGVWPGGRPLRGDGSESGVFNALNSDKRSWAVDAYDHPGWLLALGRGADLVVDSFSPRVMAQLGLGRDECDRRDRPAGALGTGSRRISMPAFPPGPLRPWVAYGTGVHALSGLGHQPDGKGAVYRAPGITYPDPLAGLQGTVAALGALSPVRLGPGPLDREVSLAGSLEPLLDRPRRLLPYRAGTGAALLRAGVASGAMAPVQDGAGRHWYPVGPFRFPDRGELRPAPGRAEQNSEGALPWTP